MLLPILRLKHQVLLFCSVSCLLYTLGVSSTIVLGESFKYFPNVVLWGIPVYSAVIASIYKALDFFKPNVCDFPRSTIPWCCLAYALFAALLGLVYFPLFGQPTFLVADRNVELGVPVGIPLLIPANCFAPSARIQPNLPASSFLYSEELSHSEILITALEEYVGRHAITIFCSSPFYPVSLKLKSNRFTIHAIQQHGHQVPRRVEQRKLLALDDDDDDEEGYTWEEVVRMTKEREQAVQDFTIYCMIIGGIACVVTNLLIPRPNIKSE